MAIAPIANPVKDLRSQLLDGLPTPDLLSIISAAKPRHMLANTVFVNQDTPAGHLFLLTEGRARHFFTTQQGHKIVLFWITPGGICGGAALLPRTAFYLVSTETVKDSQMLVWDRSTLRALAGKYPRLLDNALLITSDYFTWYLASNIALSCLNARQRLAHILINLADVIGRKLAGEIEIDVTNEELANAANITPFTCSRLLNHWQRQGALAKSRGKVLLRSRERLFLHEV